jgi:sigma-B regulation protein RsbU (phosphoserine phosphatase)
VQKELLLGEEFDRAAEVQRALLPGAAPRLAGYELDGVCVAARAVGGDFYDWQLLPATPEVGLEAPAQRDGPGPVGLGITLADVMGKGLGAAILTAPVHAVVRAAGRRHAPADVLAVAAATLDEDLSQTGTFVTLVHLQLDPATGVVRCADAGHGLTLHVRTDGSSRRITTRGLPLGILPGETWDVVTVRLEPGDLLVTVSDGFFDLHDGVVEGLEALEALTRDAASAREVVDRVRATTLGRRLPDDVTAVALRRTPPF